MKRGLAIGGAAVMLAAAALALFAWLRTFETTDNAFVMGPTSYLGALREGQVEAVWVDELDEVEAGQVLVELDPRWLRARLRQAEAEQALAAAAFEEARHAAQAARLRTDTTRATQSLSAEGRQAALETARHRLARARSEQAAAQVAVDDARRTLARHRETIAAGASTQAELDAAIAAEAQAAANLRARAASVTAQLQEVQRATKELDIAQAQAEYSVADSSPVGIADARLAVAQARLERAEAALELAKLDLESATIRAPAQGRVVKLMAHPGDAVEAGQRLVVVAPRRPRWVQAHFEEGQVGAMRPGQRAQVRLGSHPGRSFTAEVAAISDASGATTALLPQDTAVGNFIRVPQWIPVRLELEPGALDDAVIGVTAEVEVFVDR